MINERLLGYLLSKKKLFATKKTKVKDIRPLISKLYPVRSNKELVRLGESGDGGYLLPNDFYGIEACFSPGVGSLSSFEKDCAADLSSSLSSKWMVPLLVI